MKIRLAAICVAVLLFTAAPPTLALGSQSADPGAIVVDVLLVRPLGLVSTTLGATIFIISLPFAIPSRSVATVGKKLVVDPIKFTFTRPLGAEFSD